MNRDDLKEVICRVIDALQQGDTPTPGCIFGDHPCDNPCDITTHYAVGEEG